MKKIIIFMILITTFFSCEKEVDFDLINNQDVFEELDLTLLLDLANSNEDLKSATIPELDSLYLTMLYKDEGIWKLVAKGNFADTLDLEDFKNPSEIKFVPPVKVGHVLKSNCRFVIQGKNSSGKNAYYAILEKDLSGTINEEEQITVPMVETKSYFGLNVKELTINNYEYVFDFNYVKKEIDYETCLTELPEIIGQVPNYYFLNSEDTLKNQLIVNKQNVTFNGDFVDFQDYIDIAEYFGECVPEGIEIKISVYEGENLIVQNTVNKNWLEFGINHYVRISNTTTSSFTFDLIDNENIVEDWDLSNPNN